MEGPGRGGLGRRRRHFESRSYIPRVSILGLLLAWPVVHNKYSYRYIFIGSYKVTP